MPGPSLRARIAAVPVELGAADTALAVVIPALARFKPGDREIAAMLPVSDINGELAASAQAFETISQRADVCAGIMAADPFLVIDELAAALRRAGFHSVANFPTVQLIDGAAGAGLAAVGCDLAAELRTLAAFRRLGFSAHAYVIDEASAGIALDAGYSSLVFHDAFRPSNEADAVFAAVRARAGAGLLRHAPAA